MVMVVFGGFCSIMLVAIFITLGAIEGKMH